MNDLAALDATAQAELVRRKQLSARELVDAGIARIEAINPTLNAVVTPMYEQALEAVSSIAPHAPFAGVPYVMKDLVAECAGVRFTEGSIFLRDHVSAFDSELVRRLRTAGLVILGKTNTPEFGMYPHCEPALFGPTRNPWDPSRSTSGSSGGSAAAVASGMVPMAHANDLGGSIRYPASCCGLFGLKPTRARNPLGPEYGDVVSGFAVEHAVTRSVRDSAALLDATSGPDIGDPYCARAPARPFADEVGADPGRLRVALCTVPPGGHAVHPDCIAAVEGVGALLSSLGHEVTEAAPDVVYSESFGAALGVALAAATPWIIGYWVRKLGREPGPDEIEPMTQAYWEFGKQVNAGDYLRAVEELQRTARAVERFLLDYDVWLTPTLTEPPCKLGELVARPDDPASIDRVNRFVAFPGVLANVTGGPAMSVPLSWNTEGLPIGSHFLGRFGDEATLLRLAGQLEEARPWSGRRPAVHASAVEVG